MPTEAVVVVGAVSIGQAIAQRQGSGSTVLLASRNPDNLAQSARAVEACGHVVETHPVDVAEQASIEALAERAAALGDVVNVIHTAGLSPVQASAGSTAAGRPASSAAQARTRRVWNLTGTAHLAKLDGEWKVMQSVAGTF